METSYDRSLKILSGMSLTVESLLAGFKPLIWYRSWVNCLKLVNEKGSNNNNYSRYKPSRGAHHPQPIVNCSIADALYIDSGEQNKGEGEQNKKVVAMIYLTPHVIYYDMKGETTVDLIRKNFITPEEIEKVVYKAEYTFHTFDNKIVEFMKNDGYTYDASYVTLGLYCQKHSTGKDALAKKDLLNAMYIFLKNIKDLFKKTLYTPYIIHPFRIILGKDFSLKLISSSLIHYLLCPYDLSKILADVLFTHPEFLMSTGLIKDLTLTTYASSQKKRKNYYHYYPAGSKVVVDDDNNDNNNDDDDNNDSESGGSGVVETKTFQNILIKRLVLNFFHSFYLTILWLMCAKKGSLMKNRVENNKAFTQHLYLVRSKSKKTSNNIRNNNNNNNNINKNKFPKIYDGESSSGVGGVGGGGGGVGGVGDIDDYYYFTKDQPMTHLCNQPFGFCQTADFSVSERKIIHEYGCNHLLVIMPLALNTLLEDDIARREDKIQIITKLILSEMKILKQDFIIPLMALYE